MENSAPQKFKRGQIDDSVVDDGQPTAEDVEEHARMYSKLLTRFD